MQRRSSRGVALVWTTERNREEDLPVELRGVVDRSAKLAIVRKLQLYISRFRSTPTGQRWSTFLRNQAAGIWCCDLFEVRDLWFRAHFVAASNGPSPIPSAPEPKKLS